MKVPEDKTVTEGGREDGGWGWIVVFGDKEKGETILDM